MHAAHINTDTLRRHFAFHLERAAGNPLLITRSRWADRSITPAYVLAHDTWRALADTLPTGKRPADTQLLNECDGDVRDGVQTFTTRNARPVLSRILDAAEHASTTALRTATPPQAGHTIVTRRKDTADPVVFVPVVWVDMLTGDTTTLDGGGAHA